MFDWFKNLFKRKGEEEAEQEKELARIMSILDNILEEESVTSESSYQRPQQQQSLSFVDVMEWINKTELSSTQVHMLKSALDHMLKSALDKETFAPKFIQSNYGQSTFNKEDLK